MLLLYSVAIAFGGIPLLYLGDELGTLNDYSFANDPAKAGDSRWVHRPRLDAERLDQRNAPNVIGRIFSGMHQLIGLRKQHQAFAGGDTEVLNVGNDQVFAFVRRHGGEHILVLSNFSEQMQSVDPNQVRQYGLDYRFDDLLSGQALTLGDSVTLDPYHSLWLTPVSSH